MVLSFLCLFDTVFQDATGLCYYIIYDVADEDDSFYNHHTLLFFDHDDGTVVDVDADDYL